MERLEHPSLCFNPWPDTNWTAKDKPILIVDGTLYRIKSLSQKVSGTAAYVVGAGAREIEKLVSLLDVTYLHFYELRVVDLSPLAAIKKMRHLKINWNTKLTELKAIGQLRSLETLALVHVPKVKDLSPLAALSKLAALEYSGGIWSRNHAMSLEPLGSLPKLEELILTSLRVEEGGLRPLAQCRSLKELELSNTFDTEDYAYLSVALPKVECKYFAPWVRVNLSDGTNVRDTMVIGKRKPFLNSKIDAAKIAAYEEEFKHVQERFASEASLQRKHSGNRF